jgi:hypothetical protein
VSAKGKNNLEIVSIPNHTRLPLSGSITLKLAIVCLLSIGAKPDYLSEIFQKANRSGTVAPNA